VFSIPYPLLERVKLDLAALGGVLENADYGAEIALTVLLPQSALAAFAAVLTERSAGGAALTVIGEDFSAIPQNT
jgi:hypothetical protein